MLLFWTALALATPPTDLTQAASSQWTCEQSPKEMQRVVDAAVERVTDAFPYVVRGFARGKLTPSATYCTHLQIDASQSDWSSACTDGTSFSRPWEGGTQPYLTTQGTTVDSTLSYDASTVTLNFQGEEGGRTTEYRFEGDKMVMNVAIHSDKLPAPFTWQFTYNRKP